MFMILSIVEWHFCITDPSGGIVFQKQNAALIEDNKNLKSLGEYQKGQRQHSQSGLDFCRQCPELTTPFGCHTH